MLTEEDIRPGAIAYFAPSRLAYALGWLSAPEFASQDAPRPFVCCFSHVAGCGWFELSSQPTNDGRLLLQRDWLQNVDTWPSDRDSYVVFGTLWVGRRERFAAAAEDDSYTAETRPQVTHEGQIAIYRAMPRSDPPN